MLINTSRGVREMPCWFEQCSKGSMDNLTENIKGDKIKALALAKECYAMKLELLTNATVVGDAIRFVASNAASTEKANFDKINIIDDENNS